MSGKFTEPDSRFQNILKDLRIIFRAIQSHSRLVEKKSGLSSAQLWMLWELHNAPGLKVSQLASILSIHQSTCSNMLDKLEAKEFVYRKRISSDQRVVLLFLSEKGAEVLARAPKPAQGALTEALLRLPDATLLNLGNGLSELVEALNNPDQAASMKPISTGSPDNNEPV